MNHHSLVSALGMLTLLTCSACSASNQSVGTRPHGGGNGSGAGSGLGSGNTSSGGSSNTDINVNGDAGRSNGEVMNGVCDNQSFDLQLKPTDILIVLDRSASMIRDTNDVKIPAGSATLSKWTIVQQGLTRAVTSTDSTISWGLKAFPEGEGKACITGSVTSAILVGVAAMNAGAVNLKIGSTTPAGNGTPTGDAIKAAVTYFKALPDQNQKFILLATDGQPSCAGTVEDEPTARPYAVTAIADAAEGGIKTIVVGIATTKDTAAAALNDMAVAGQMPVVSAVPTANKYYLATTVDELVTNLETITGQVSSCVFDLSSVPPAPDNIAVHVNGMKAPRDTAKADGWDYTSPDLKQIQVYGTWCEQIKAANANTVNFVFGCPGQDPPA